MFAPCLSLAYLLLSTHRNNIAFSPLKARYCISQHTLRSAVNTLAWDLEFLSNHIGFVCVYLHLQRYQTFLDSTVPHLTSRWIATLVMMLLFMARIFYLQVEHFSLWQHNCHSALQSCFLCTFVSRAWHFLLNFHLYLGLKVIIISLLCFLPYLRHNSKGSLSSSQSQN